MTHQDHKARVLVVEDTPAIRRLYASLLGRYFDVEVAGNVSEALQAAEQEHFDLFLLDIHLGEKRSGVDLLTLLRQMPRHRSTPAIACTASVDICSRTFFLLSGFDEYVPKPFDPQHLHTTIDTVLNHRIVRDESTARYRKTG